jgi:hypothetical protein
METLATVLSVVFGIGSLVCFIAVVVAMFREGETIWGILSLLGVCCGVGALLAFVMGWLNSGSWGIQNVMWIWTICFVGGIVVAALL